MHTFGIGGVFATPAGTNQTTVQAGTVQEVSVDFQFDNKELRGQMAAPVAAARTALKVSGKVKFAKIFGAVLNGMFVNGTLSAGCTLLSRDEAGTPDVSTHLITVAHSADYTQDMGVVYKATGLPLTRVAAGSEAAGKYSVVESGAGKGVYTFHTSDTGAMKVSYLYTSTGGTTVSMDNQLMGDQPSLSLFLHQKFNSKQANLKLYNVVFSKLTWPCKNEDFTVLETDFVAYCDAADNLADFYLEE